MSANLYTNEGTGKQSFFSVKEKPWHGGLTIDEYPNSAEALIFAGLDNTVVKRPNIHRLDNGEEIVSNSSFYTYRPDTGAILGDKLGADYHVVQNVDAFGFFDSIVGGGDGILYETAGALGNGERIFITAKLPEYIRVGREDLIEQYIFLTNSHNGTGSITAAFTPVRIVCQNTLNAAMRNMSNCIKIRHTANAEARLKQAHTLMGIADNLGKELETIFNRWSNVRITDTQVKKLIQQAMCPSKEVYGNLLAGKDDMLSTAFKNICENAHAYALGNETQQMVTTRGTLFGAYNAVTGYYQNVKEYKNADAKMQSLLYGGTGQMRTQKAFDLCTSFEKTDSLEMYN